MQVSQKVNYYSRQGHSVKPRLFFSTSVVGREQIGLQFDPTRDHTFCRLCGAVFQGALDTLPPNEITIETAFAARIERREWSFSHERTHPGYQHESLRRSGRFMTPEAAQELIPLGIIPVQDIVMDQEVAHAAATASRMPKTDRQTTLKRREI